MKAAKMPGSLPDHVPLWLFVLGSVLLPLVSLVSKTLYDRLKARVDVYQLLAKMQHQLDEQGRLHREELRAIQEAHDTRVAELKAEIKRLQLELDSYRGDR